MGKYQYMNLEQKLAKIRKKMPLLLKKYHNDEADYDFATLDDIYASLTPALNQYGVNFDIVKETPTQYGEDGKPAYLTLDKDDYWRYEADLELSWTNIDNPKEVNHVVTHIVGTHDIPDKAHGTALTYGLKYYFRNKFCMRQLGSVQEDPDGMEYGTEESGESTRKTDSQNWNQKGMKPETSKPEKENRTDKGHAEKAKGNKISGNACPEPKNHPVSEQNGKSAEPESDVRRKDEEKVPEKAGMSGKESAQKEKGTGMPVQKQNPDTEGQQPETGKGTRQQPETTEQRKTAGQPEEDRDGFHAAGSEEVPFENESFMDELEREMEAETGESDSGLEAAKNYVCNFGLYKGKTLGEMMNSGLKGVESVKWMATRYQGPDKRIAEAAKLLMENKELVMERQAA